MNQKQLSYFMEVYRTRNIQAAADRLYISHQGLSRVINALEDELGQQLFVRSNRGLEPTDFATTLVPHVQRLLDDFLTIQGIHSLTSSDKAVVSIASLDHVLGYLGADFVADFAGEYPDITLSVTDTTDEHALECLSAGKCDFAFVNGPIDNTRFAATPLFYSRYCFRINKANPLATKEHLSVDDFDGQRLIGKGRAYHCFRTNINRYIFEAGRDIAVPVETSDERLMQELVERNFAIAVTYDFSARDYCGENSVIRYLDDKSMGHHIYLVEKQGTLPTKAARVFKRFLLDRLPM